MNKSSKRLKFRIGNFSDEVPKNKSLVIGGFLEEVSRNKCLFLMILPTVIYFLIFAYLPMGGLIIAFKNYNYTQGIFGSPWCGLSNFEFFFGSGKAWQLTLNTFSYNITFLAVGTFFNVVTGIILAEVTGKWYKKLTQSVILFPHLISWVVIGVIAYNILNFDTGLLNSTLKALGKESIQVYNMPGAWPYILAFLNTWKGVGYGSIFYLSAITSFDSECYEAAWVDGAGLFRRIWFVTLPMLMPTIITLLLLNLGGILRGNFDMFYQLIGTNGTLYNATDIIDTYVFRSLIDGTNLGMSSAASFYQSIVCFVFITLANALVKKYDESYALF